MEHDMTTTFTAGVAGRYKFIAHKPDGSSRDLTDWFDNLITDGGLERMGTGGTTEKCRVGSGNTTPNNTDTALVAQVAEADIYSYTEGADTDTNLYAWRRIVYRFAVGAAAGNLSEVGVGWAGGALFSRALIKDGVGNPTTITVLSDEILDVVYELRMYRPTSDLSANIDIAGVTYACTVRPANFSNWRCTELTQFGAMGNGNLLVQGWGSDAALGAVTGQPTGTMVMGGVYATNDGAYIGGSKQRKLKVIASISDATSPIKALTFRTALGLYQMLVNPVIPKNNTNKLTLYYTLAWARH